MKKKIKSSLAKTVTLGVSAATVVTMLPVNAMAMEKVPASLEETQSQETAKPAVVNEATIENANKAVDDTVAAITDAVKAVDALGDVIKAVADAKSALAGVDGVSLGGVSDSIENAQNAADKVADSMTAASDAEAQVLELVNKSEDINITLKLAISTNLEALRKATTVEEAVAAYDVLVKAIGSAKEQMGNASADYDKLVEKYGTVIDEAKEADDVFAGEIADAGEKISSALSAIKAAEEKVEALIEVLETAQNDRAELIKSYEEKVAALEKDIKEKEEEKKAAEDEKIVADDAVDAQNEVVKAAEEALKTAQEEAKKASQDVKTAEENMNANKIALDILEKEKAVQDANKVDYDKLDNLFMAIFQNYYVPYIIKPAEGSNVEFTSNKFTKFSEDKKNYYSFKIDGKEYFYNYVVDKKTRELVIFEKTAHEEIISSEVPARYVYVGENTSIELSEAQYKQALDDNIIYVRDGKSYYLLPGTDNIYKFDKADNQTVSGEKKSDVYDVTGKTTTTTADVTTTTYESASISSKGDVFASEEDARADAGSKLAKGDKDLNISISKTEEYTAEAQVSYAAKYTMVIQLEGYKVKRGNNWKDYSDIDKDFEKEAGKYAEDVKVICNAPAVKKTKDNWLFDDEYTFTGGTVTITFSRCKEEINYSLWNNITDFFNRGKVEKAVKENLNAQGKIDIDFNSFNWNGKTADVTVTDGSTVKAEGKGSTKEEANKAALAAAKANSGNKEREAERKNGMLSALSWKNGCVFSTEYVFTKENVNKVSLTDTKYGYSATYNKQVVTVEKDVVILKTLQKAVELEYIDKVPAVTKTVYLNDKYNADEDCFYEFSDEAFRAFLKKGSDSKDAYEAALKAKETADKKVEDLADKLKDEKDIASEKEKDAKEAGDKLQKVIDNLDDLMKDKEQAEKDLEAAKKTTDYSDAINKAKAAMSSIAASKESIDALAKEVDGSLSPRINSAELIALNALMEVDVEKFEFNKDDFNKTTDDISDLDDIRDDKLAELNKADDTATDDTVTDDTATDDTVTDNTVDETVNVDNADEIDNADNTGNVNENVTDTETPDEEIDDNQKVVEIEDNEVPTSAIEDDENEIVEIEDNEVPLANPASKSSRNMMWMLAIPVVGVAAFGIYLIAKKKKEEEEETES